MPPSVWQISPPLNDLCLLWLWLAPIGGFDVSIKSNFKIIVSIGDQSYKASTIVIYDSRVVPDLKIPHITTVES